MSQERNKHHGDASPGKAFVPPRVTTGFGIQVSDAQFNKLAKLVYRVCGINLGEGKKELMKARLAKRLRAVGVSTVKEYISLLEQDSTGQELVGFVDSITTNKTDFFREAQHFDFLASEVLPALPRLCGNEPLRLWSAACSSGEEPYTLSIVLLQNRAHWSGRGCRVLASDISTKVLEAAQRGVYAKDRVMGIPKPMLSQFFQRGQNQWSGHVRVKPEVRSLVDFKRINLMEPFNFTKPFHVIFCRNVMIYFDKPTQERLVAKFYDTMAPGGYLFVGHSESLTGISHRFGFVRPAVYRKEG